MGRRMRAVLVVLGLVVASFAVPAGAAAKWTVGAGSNPNAVVQPAASEQADARTALAPVSTSKVPQLPPRHWRPAGGMVETPLTGGVQPAGSHVSHYAAEPDPAPRAAALPATARPAPGASETTSKDGGSPQAPEQIVVSQADTGARIYGLVTDVDEQPIANVWVTARTGYNTSYSVQTAVDGSYSLTVGVGSWEVFFYDNSQAHASGYHAANNGFAYTWADEELVTTDAADVEINVALPPPLVMSGSVVGFDHPEGADYSTITISLHGPGIPTVVSPLGDGSWTVSGLAGGSYTVEYVDATMVYGHCWYTASGCSRDYTAAETLTLGPSMSTSQGLSFRPHCSSAVGS